MSLARILPTFRCQDEMIRRHCDAVEVDHVAQAVADDAAVRDEVFAVPDPLRFKLVDAKPAAFGQDESVAGEAECPVPKFRAPVGTAKRKLCMFLTCRFAVLDDLDIAPTQTGVS